MKVRVFAVGSLALVAALLTTAVSARAQDELWPRGCPVASPLRDVHAGWRDGRDIETLPTIRALRQRWHRSPWQQGRVAVELVAQSEVDTRTWSAWLLRNGATVEAPGSTAWLAWLPPAALPLLPQLPGLQQARLPLPMRTSAGASQSLGARKIGAVRSQCGGGDGSGVTILVVDSDWHGLNAAIDAGEIPNFAGKIPYQAPDPDSNHGTSCAEVIADVAPGATLMAQPGETLPQLQVALPKLAAAGVQVVSLSGGWSTGWSFGDGTGPLCTLVSKIKKLGVAWINAAGNEADGQIWHGAWQDADADGWLEFSGSKETNSFQAYQGYPVDIELDWDAYPVTAIDLDLYVCSSKAPCTEVASSKGTQDGGQSPWETMNFEPPDSGVYYIAIRAKAPPPAGQRLRLVTYGASLTISKVYSTLTHPADCADTMAVGAVDVAKWAAGKPVAYSSRGPTFDGRSKPDLVAPTDVETSSDDDFNGTSAACPHAAGAVAVLMQRDGLSALDAAAKLIATAEPVGKSVPNDDTGWGKLALGGSEAWCLVEDQGLPCTDSCGTDGALLCEQDCAPRTCQADPACVPAVDPDANPAGPDAGADALTGGDGAATGPVAAQTPSSSAGCGAAPRRASSGLLWLAVLAAAAVVRRWGSRA